MSTPNRPNYQQLYADMIRDKYPEKEKLCTGLLKKKNWIALDVIAINKILFDINKKDSDKDLDKKHRAYDTESILKILRYQYENELTNVDTVELYGISKNTLTKWKKAYKEQIASF